MKHLLYLMMIIPVFGFSQPTKRLSGDFSSNNFPKYNAASGHFEAGDVNDDINTTQNLTNTGTLDGLNGSQLLRNDNAAQYNRQLGFAQATLTDGTTSWNLETQQNAKLVLTQNTNIQNPTNAVAGNVYRLAVEQTGAFTLSFGTSYKTEGVTIGSTTGAKRVFVFYYDGEDMLLENTSLTEALEQAQINNSNLMIWAAAHRTSDAFRTRFANEMVQDAGDEIYNYYDPSYEALSLHSGLGTTQPTFTVDSGNSAWSFDGTDDYLSWFESSNMTFVSNNRVFSFFFV